MSADLIKFAFVAGELSPTFLGRTDLEKFDFGLATAINWFVDYRGGISTRPATVFVDYIMEDDKTVKMFEFKFAPDVANTYILLFGHQYIRFIQDGAYVLEAAKTITGVTTASPGVVTVTAHGYVTGDWVKIANRTFEITKLTNDTFSLQFPYGENFDTTGTDILTATEVSRIYTLTTTYTSDDIPNISISQYRDLVRITNTDFPIYNLRRNDNTDWELTTVSFGSPIAAPGNLAGTPTAIGDAGTTFCVTAVDNEGNESLPSEICIVTNMVNYSTTSGALEMNWDLVTGAKYYNVYRSILVPEGKESRAQQLGFLGKAYGATFIDNNILPDFTRTPPIHYDPFAGGSIYQIDVTAPGSGYTQASTVSVSGGGGTGFVGFPIVNSAGEIVGVNITNGGSGYSEPITITFSVGTGATAEASITQASGNYPALSARFQQRQNYAATDNAPMSVWGSQPGRLDNFDYSEIVIDSDSYEFELDSDEVTPIKHMISVRGGLLLMTNGGIWMLSGGGDGQPVTPTQALAEPHTYAGVADVTPIKIDTDLIYVEDKGGSVRLLSYNDFSNIYSSQDISILSNHFFTKTKYVTRWTFASDPYKLIWARRSDGCMLSFTTVKEQNVYAWTQNWTRGFFQDVLNIQENNTDRVYTIVKRKINGRWTQYIEYFGNRQFDHIESAICMDCGLASTHTYPDATLAADVVSGTVVFTASAAVFNAGTDVGKVIRAGGGKAVITAVNSTTEVEALWLRTMTSVIPESGNIPLEQLSGTWTLDAPFTTLSGFWHLEGEQIDLNLDGNIVQGLTVVNGSVTLPFATTKAYGGLPFRCIAKTLPLTTQEAIIEGRRKRVVGTVARLNETRGLKSGRTLEKLYELKERTNEIPGEPNNPVNGLGRWMVMPKWDDEGSLYYVQEYSLPSSILGLIFQTEVGDDPD